ncbi:protein phosphatase 2C domain-containing protein [Asticcacaulis sp. AND118]|uniref:protein phosphatase 2C domain-containing protein n=1 Tax=Asticcacaulis sp. AND118 TaxID=2840468 RepID=UPI001CFFF820|nr:protein phosphatase 2C domain-containing protein [Asticcacaulis sp. AND118]UDF02863.1 protein phosphatase 2C domain-containing protein [Asticcacaulis sp. AND118]
MRIVSQGSDRGGVYNEDALGASGDAVWLLDGATSLGPSRLEGISDAAWFAHTVSHNLEAKTGSIRDRLSAAIGEARTVYEASGPLPEEPWAMPSAGAAMVRRDGDELELGVLGDVKVWLIAANGAVTALSGGEVLEALDAAALEQLVALRAEQGPIGLKAARLQLDPLLRENRAKMNTEGGYWVLSLDDACLDGMEVTRVPAAQARYVLMATDGFYDLWGAYGVPFTEVFEGLISGRGEALTQALRDIERADPEGLRYPRFKPHDDASWVLIEI